MIALPRGPRAAGSALLVGIVLFAALLAWASSPRAVFADDPPKTEAKAAAAAPEEDLERLLLKNIGTALVLAMLKWAPAAAGVVFVILAEVRRGRIARGELPPDPVRPPPTAPFPIGSSVLIFAVFMVTPSLAILAAQAAGLAPKVESMKDLPIGWRVGTMAAASAIVAALVMWRRAVLRARGAPPPLAVPAALLQGGRSFCVFSGLGILLALLAKFVLEGIFHIPNRAQDLVHDVVYSKNILDPLLITLFGVVLAPLVEECIHRGMLYAAFRTVFGRLLSVALSSFLFAILHVQKREDWHAFFPLLGLAALLAFLYERTNSLVAVVTVHVLNNATTLLPLLMLRGT